VNQAGHDFFLQQPSEFIEKGIQCLIQWDACLKVDGDCSSELNTYYVIDPGQVSTEPPSLTFFSRTNGQ
jgi:hypothetical protein